MIPCFPLKNALKYELTVQSCSMPKYSLLSLALHNSDLFLGNLVEGAALFMLKQPRAYHKWLTEVIFRRVSFSLWLPIVLLTKGVAKHAKCCSFELIYLPEKGIAILCIFQPLYNEHLTEKYGVLPEVTLAHVFYLPADASVQSRSLQVRRLNKRAPGDAE
jgi:hypothetical protein